MEKALKNVIVVTYYWPPAGGPGVQRWVGLTRYFEENGLHPIVVIPKNAAYPQLDERLRDFVSKSIEFIQVPILEPTRWAQRLGFSKVKDYSKGSLPQSPKGFVERFLFYIRGQLFIPDSRVFWIRPLKRTLFKRLKQGDIEAVITTGPPHSVHLAMLGLIRKPDFKKVKWIADFRDPWTEIGYHKPLNLNQRTLIRHQKLERQVLKGAHLVLTTTNTLATHYRQVYQANVATITNGFSTYYERPKVEQTKIFNILHVGSLFEHRNPVAFWQALSELRTEGMLKAVNIRIQFLGEVSKSTRQSLEQAKLLDYCDFEGYVPKHEIEKFVQRTSLLLLCEGQDEAYEFAVPGKLYDYLAMNIPILAIGPKRWELANLVEGQDDISVVTHDQKESMKAFISCALLRFEGQSQVLRTERDVERFEHQYLSKQLAFLIERL
ncbi:MAG: hypothetical protein RLZZ242_172 [Bacteroidota bacterium]